MNQTGEWCKQNGEICDYHTDSYDVIKPKNQCSGMFFGTCANGNCYVSASCKPKNKTIEIKQCRKENEGAWYERYIGTQFPVRFETLDCFCVAVEDDEDIRSIPRKDCSVFVA